MRILKYCFVFSSFIFAIYCMSIIFGIDITFFETKFINNQQLITFNIYKYINNFNGTFDKFQEIISELGQNHYDWSDIIKAVKSIGNILITVVNSLLIPFSLLGSLLNVLCAFFGLPMNTTNPLYTIFNGIAALQIPYIEL